MGDTERVELGGRGLTLLGVSVLITAGVLLAAGWRTVQLHRQRVDGLHLQLEREALRNDVLYLDEALSASARMATVTDEPRWPARYADLLQRWTLTRQRAAAQGLRWPRRDALSNERDALAHAARGERDAATTFLDTPSYERLRTDFHAELAHTLHPPTPHAVSLRRLRGTILYLDEVLTMSARLGVATTDPAWERRYDTSEPRLADALQQAIQLTAATPSRTTDSANTQLVHLEREALGLVRSGRHDDAHTLLSSTTYEALKHDYLQGMSAFDQDLLQDAHTSMERERRRVTLEVVAVLATLTLLLLGWAFIYSRTHRWRRLLLQRNRTLDERVAARTHELEQARARFVERVLHVQDDERRRLARELHDGLGQELTSLLLTLHPDASPDPDTLRERLRHVLDDLGRLSRGLHPSSLDHLGFVPSLQHLARDLFQPDPTRVDVLAHGFDAHPLPKPVELALYRIAQEALHNARKHAHAHSVSVVAERTPDRVRLIVEDDGDGLPPHPQHGLGLISMRERTALLGGSFTLESSPERGTTLFVDIPLTGTP